MPSHKNPIFAGAFFGYVALITQMLVQLAVLPLMVKHLGKEILGAYSFVLQILGFVTVLELGFSTSLGQSLTQAEAIQKNSLIYTTQKAGLVGCGMFGLLYFIILLSLALLVDYLPFMNDFRHESLRASFIILGVSSFIKSLFQVYGLTLTSRNQQWLFHLGTLIGTVIRAVLFLVVIYNGMQIEALIISYACADLATVLFHYFMCPRAGIRTVSVGTHEILKIIRKIAKFGRSLAPMQIASRLTYSSDSIIVGLLAGPSSVASFYSTQMPSFLVFQSIFVLPDTFLPHLTRLHVSGKRQEFDDMCRFLYRLSVGLGICLMFGILSFNEMIIHFWMGEGVFAGQLMNGFLAIFCAQQVILHPFVLFLVSMGDLKGWGFLAFGGACLKIALSFILGYSLGVPGVMLASALVEVPLGLTLLKKNSSILFQLPAHAFKSDLLAFGLHFLSIGSISILLSWFFGQRDLIILVVHVFVYLLLNVMSFYFLVLNREERSFLISKMPFLKKI